MYMRGRPLPRAPACSARSARAPTRHGAHEASCGAQTFHSRNGKAYLFQSVALINIIFGAQEERVMTTGRPERLRLAVQYSRPCCRRGCR
jgi:hypothetical protein